MAGVPDECRILIVAGAGASHNLARGDDGIPLMGGWAERLRKDLETAEQGLAQAIGLKSDSTPRAFEQALGNFFGLEPAWRLVRKFEALANQRSPAKTPDFRRQMDRIKERIDKVTEAVHHSMFREFGLSAIDPEKASLAYEAVIRRFPQGSTFVFATTNYDVAIETALGQLGHTHSDGFNPSGLGTPEFVGADVVDWDTGHGGKVPVLHLHGAVGWYLDDEERPKRQYADQPFNPTLGRPLFLPPDPNKDPSTMIHMKAIWNEFTTALEGATHVLVIGHSLSDSVLCNALSRASDQGTPVAVTTHLSEDSESTLASDTPFPGATMIQADFGPEPWFGSELDHWLPRSEAPSDTGHSHSGPHVAQG